MFLLSQAANAPGSASRAVIIWSCVLVAMLLLLFAVVMKIKKRMRVEIDRTPESPAGFTLAELRQLHRAGQISDDELERAKAKIVAAARRAAERDQKKPELETGKEAQEE